MQGETCTRFDSAMTINGGETISFSDESCAFSRDCFSTNIMTRDICKDFQTYTLPSEWGQIQMKKTSIQREK